jgi:hypothetical protein
LPSGTGIMFATEPSSIGTFFFAAFFGIAAPEEG